MSRLLAIKLPASWKVTHSAFPDVEPFNAEGERNYEVGEDLYQAELRTNGSILLLDIGFYATGYAVRLIKDGDWESPLVVKNAKDRNEAKRVAEDIGRTYVPAAT